MLHCVGETPKAAVRGCVLGREHIPRAVGSRQVHGQGPHYRQGDQPMRAQWYYKIMGEEFGPVSSSELRGLAQTSQISPDTLVRKGVDGDWIRAERVRGLFEPADSTLREKAGVPAPSASSAAPTSPTESPCPSPKDGAVKDTGRSVSPARRVEGRRKKVYLALAAVCVVLVLCVVLGVFLPSIVGPQGGEKEVAEQLPAQTAQTTELDTRQQAAIAEIRNLGGEVHFDETSRKKPVVGVRFGEWSLVTDASLKQLKGLTNLQELYLSDDHLRYPARKRLSRTLLELEELPSAQITDAGLVHVGGLSNLRVLHLDNSDISDAGLEHLRGLAGLEDLSLAHSRVTDAGLQHLKGLRNLQALDLSHTRVTDAGLLHLKRMSQLQSLGLGHTQVDLMRADTLIQFTELKRLDLSGLASHFPRHPLADVWEESESGPPSINLLLGMRRLKGLESLNLSGTSTHNHCLAFLFGTERTVPELAPIQEHLHIIGLNGLDLNRPPFQDLKLLDLSDTQVDDSGLRFLEKLPSLQELYLNGTGITDAGLESLEGLRSLQVLHLSGTKLTDAGLEHLERLTELQELVLGMTGVTDAGLKHLEKLTNLRVLGLAMEGLEGSGLEHLTGLSKLEVLDLGTNPLQGGRLEHLKRLTKLQLLRLHETGVTDVDLEHLARLTNLRFLGLMSTKVTDAGLAHLEGLTNLRSLQLSVTRIRGGGLKHLKGLTGLQALDLGATHVTDAGLGHLTGLTNLRKLELGSTQITDGGLEHLRGLTGIQELTLSSPRITDTGLECLSEMASLRALMLSTSATDAGLKHLTRLARLRLLYLAESHFVPSPDVHKTWGTGVTDEGVKGLKEALPDCEIIRAY